MWVAGVRYTAATRYLAEDSVPRSRDHGGVLKSGVRVEIHPEHLPLAETRLARDLRDIIVPAEWIGS